nr:MAG TPA: hypothetical protein [Caudoviricetes sp.]
MTFAVENDIFSLRTVPAGVTARNGQLYKFIA